MITPLTTKLHPEGFNSPYYEVDGKRFYTKYHALEHCRSVGWEWPTFKVWEISNSFKRPKKNFKQSIKTQCEILSDTYKKVRLFYSGGKDSNLILHNLLETKSKLDEIAVYRRFPGVVDNDSNEFDQFNILDVIKKILAHYNTKVPVKFYDIMPEHFNYYSSRLDKLFFPYTDLDFFMNGIHTIAEIYPKILDNEFVNVLGHAFPDVNNNNEFYWIDGGFNYTQPDPYAVNFFCDSRNTDLAVNMAYTMRDYLQSHGKTSNEINWANGEYKNFKPVRDILGFPNTGTPLDTKYDALNVDSVTSWILQRKILVRMANAQKSEIGRQTFDNFVRFYQDYEGKFARYFNKHSIYERWVGSISEKHLLVE